MTEKKHDKTTTCASDNLHGEPADSGEAFNAYLAAVLSPFGGKHEMPAVHGNVDEFESAAIAKKANVLDDPLGAKTSNDDVPASKPVKERLIELVGLYCIEGEHQVSRNSLDSHVNSSFSSDNATNRITAIAQSFACGAVGAVTALAFEKLIG